MSVVNENLTLDMPLANLYSMKLVRPLAVMLALGILLFNTGDCINFFFAEAKASDCCLTENCPMSSAEQMDACCKTPTSQSGSYVQGPSHASIAQRSTSIIDFPVDTLVASGLHHLAYMSNNWQDHAPPGVIASFSLPLLI